MIRNINSPKKHQRQSQILSNTEISPFVISDLQQTIPPRTFLTCKDTCKCQLCLPLIPKPQQNYNIFHSSNKASSFWLKKILEALCVSRAKTLKLNLPDILFLQGQNLQIYQSSRKDGRLVKLNGNFHLKTLYVTVVRLRKQYKSMLEMNFNKKMIEHMDPQCMHFSYFDKFVPSFFHDGMENIKVLQENRSRFKKYILHKNKKYEIQQIQEHKMNDKQPFCIVKYNDGNCQLFNQVQFEVYTLQTMNKLMEQLVLVQSYIKYKLQTEAIYYSEYILGPDTVKQPLDKRAENEVMVLLGGLSKFQKGHIDIDSIEELAYQLMMADPKGYVKLMTHKIVHYLAMTSSIYIDHIKIKWIMNDLGTIYLQQVMDLQISEVPRRLVKYRLPPKEDLIMGHGHTKDIYQELKRKKHQNTLAIRKRLSGKSYEQILNIIDKIETQQDSEQVESSSSVEQEYLSYKAFTLRKNKQSNVSINLALDRLNNPSKRSRQPHKKNQRQEEQTKKRSYSVGLDKWRNVRMQDKKQRISQKINTYFTISTERTLKQSQKRTASTGHQSLRYNMNPEPDFGYNTISSFKQTRPGTSEINYRTSRSITHKR